MSSDYVLITPARNEEASIERTLESMVAQTHLPLRWVVVDDGSTDRTGEIVERYEKQYAWIELLRLPRRQQRHADQRGRGGSPRRPPDCGTGGRAIDGARP